MAGAFRKSYVDLVEQDTGISAFAAGAGGVEFVTDPPVSPLPQTLYIDPDCKELYFLDSSGSVLCTAYIGKGCLLVLEDLCGHLQLEDLTGKLRD